MCACARACVCVCVQYRYSTTERGTTRIDVGRLGESEQRNLPLRLRVRALGRAELQPDLCIAELSLSFYDHSAQRPYRLPPLVVTAAKVGRPPQSKRDATRAAPLNRDSAAGALGSLRFGSAATVRGVPSG